MSQEVTLGIVRHILSTIGGMIVVKGYADDATVTAIVGGAVALIGVVWSVLSKK